MELTLTETKFFRPLNILTELNRKNFAWLGPRMGRSLKGAIFSVLSTKKYVDFNVISYFFKIEDKKSWIEKSIGTFYCAYVWIDSRMIAGCCKLASNVKLSKNSRYVGHFHLFSESPTYKDIRLIQTLAKLEKYFRSCESPN